MGYKEGSANTNGSVFVCHPTYKQPIIQYSPTRFGVFKSFLNKSFFSKGCWVQTGDDGANPCKHEYAVMFFSKYFSGSKLVVL